MRILIAGKQHFDPGGISASTDQLARLVARRGHHVAVVAHAEWGLRWVDRPRRALQREPVDGYVAYSTGLLPPGAALRAAIREESPDVLVINAGGAFWHDWTRAFCAAAPSELPTALYVRDVGAIEQLADGTVRPDLVITNAHAHSRTVEDLGYQALTIPSLIDADAYRVTPTGEAVVFINPVAIKGRDIAFAVAERCPDITFHFRETWPLKTEEWTYVTERVSKLGNATYFPHTDDRADPYRPARLLLVPYVDRNRPRVVPEAQVSGIPIVARDDPALHECVGPGGVLVAPDAPIEAWVTAVRQLWDDDTTHHRLAHAARRFADREEIAPDHIVDQFIAAAEQLRNRGVTRPARWSTTRTATEEPEVSVIVPVLNVAATIGEQLEALADQSFAGSWEVVVADNGSTDATRERVEAHRAELPPLRIVDAGARRGVAHARNIGLRAARGHLLLICDGDDIVDPDWLERMVLALAEHPIVTGFLDVITMNEPEQYQWLGAPPEAAPVAYDFLPYAPGGNIGMWREVFESVGGFDEDLRRAEDIDFSWRASYLGVRVFCEPEAVIYRQLRRSPAANFLAGLKGGYAEPRLYRLHRSHGMTGASMQQVRAEYGRLIRTLFDVIAGRADRYAWGLHAGKRLGRVAGSLRARAVFL